MGLALVEEALTRPWSNRRLDQIVGDVRRCMEQGACRSRRMDWAWRKLVEP